MKFINLHVHSLHSHDSPSKIQDIVKFVKEQNQGAVALTDHGNMSGVPSFFRECKKNGIKSIAGNEFYITRNNKLASEKNSENRKLNHLVVLAKNLTGYKNLLKLTSLANQLENYYYKPRIDKVMLEEHKEGLIIINGHIGTSLSEIFFNEDGVYLAESVEDSKKYLKPDVEEIFKKEADWFKDVFGDDFYVEIQLFDKVDIFQQSLGYNLLELADKFGFQTVGTGDAHYVYPKDSIYHKTFVAIKQNLKVATMNKCRYLDSGMYGMVTNQQALECYPERLIKATNDIADKIEEYEIEAPFKVPCFSANPAKELREICEEQMGLKVPENKEYRDRLEYELTTLALGNVESYFLLVRDYIEYAKSQDILVGPSRGCLQNTNIIMANGDIKDISEVEVGDEVITLDGSAQKVLNLFKYDKEPNEKLLKIIFEDTKHDGIILTKDHKVYIQKSLKESISPNWVEAKDIQVNDMTYIPYIKYSSNVENELPIIAKIEEIDGENYVYDIQVENNSNYLTTSGIVHNSSAGCLVSYLCGITEVDPIQYGLLFERFISEDRLKAGQMPDIDTDFSASKREIVLEYIKDKYGSDKVSELITYGTLQGKGALKDVLRVYNACDFSTMNKITDLIPQKDKISDKLAEFEEEYGTSSLLIYSLVTDPESLSDYCKYDPDTKEFSGEYGEYFMIAAGLEGSIKSESKHPCAVIISNSPISDDAPIFKDKNGNLLCGFDGKYAEAAGLLKCDILGIGGLDKLQTLNELIKKIPIDV